MSQSRSPAMRLGDLIPGQTADFFALLSEKVRAARRDGKPYFTCRFRDAGRVVACMIWADGPWFEVCDTRWQQGQFYKLNATYQEHPTYGPQIELHDIRPIADEDSQAGFNPFDFVERTRRDVNAMFDELCLLAETHIADVPLRGLVLSLLKCHETALKQRPATLRHFYPFAGGLLEHILSVTRTSLLLVDYYLAVHADLQPPLNRDLVVAGAILHDLGRVVELGDDVVNVQPTVPGRMLGHILLGRDLVRDMARELGDVDGELVGLLEHIILSHLTLPEWGSPRLPVIPECLILHHADDLDAKLEMYVRCLSRDQDPGPFTARDPVLGKALLKGRKA
jgi:3'-5' exoribonuclease